MVVSWDGPFLFLQSLWVRLPFISRYPKSLLPQPGKGGEVAFPSVPGGGMSVSAALHTLGSQPPRT